MDVLAVDGETGRVEKSEHIQMVDRLMKIRQEKPFWEVVDEVVKLWHRRNPERWDSFIVHLKAVKQDQKVLSRKSNWRGVSKADGIERSLVVDFPVWIDMCLRLLYKNNEDVQFDKKFYRRFAKRFPLFRVREKV